MCNTRPPPCVPAPVSSPLGLCPEAVLPSLQTLSFLEYDHKSSHCPLPTSHMYPILDRFFSIQNRWPLTKVLLLNPPPPHSRRNYKVSTIHLQLTLPSSLIGDVLVLRDSLYNIHELRADCWWKATCLCKLACVLWSCSNLIPDWPFHYVMACCWAT